MIVELHYNQRRSFILLRSYAVGPGFYIDVGAYAPKEHSNTYWFCKQGWRGINIDATPGVMYAFNLVRRKDINLEAAVSSQNIELYSTAGAFPRS